VIPTEAGVVNEDIRLSALVVLRPANDRAGSGPITSEVVGFFMPSRAAVEATTSFFSERGFDVSDVVAISFSITGSRSLFEDLFGQRVQVERRRGGELASVRLESGSLEFSLSALPKNISRNLQAVTFTPPPDFGPGNP
jgi:hypothetical protein